MRLATRLFLGTSALVAATAVGLILAADRILRDGLEQDMAGGLEREARLIALQLSPDSLRWPDQARDIGNRIGHRVTLIDSSGRVRGDADFDRASLPRLENHAGRPEVRAALATGVGTSRRVSASTNEGQLYVALRGGPPGLAIVRVSATFDVVDGRIHAMQRGIAGAGFVAIGAAFLVAWLLSGGLARPLIDLTTAARAIATGAEPRFPDSRIREIAQHALALRAMHEELSTRFATLLREREETRTLIESMADGVIAANARGDIVSCNGAARRLLRRQPSDTLPPLAELFHDKAARSLVEDLLAGSNVDARELMLDGRGLLVTGRGLPNGGTLLVLRDITELRRLEAVRRDFVANVSHELKTPLTSIAGYAETLVAETAPESQDRRFAITILDNARRMQRLVDDLLDLSRIESGGYQPAREVLDVAAAATDAWALFAERAQQRGIHFELDVAPAAHVVYADSDALREILTNLLDNALRHTPSGRRVGVYAKRSTGGVTLSVGDTGSGIAPDHLPRIFERFYRVDPGRSRAEGGTGLGLAIVKHLVEAHGGHVEAESSLGRGTTIRMFFPDQQRSLA